MIGLMMVVVTVGLASVKLIPTETRREERVQVDGLNASLSQIRQAMAMKKRAVEIAGGVFNPDLAPPLSSQKIAGFLDSLQTEMFLIASSVVDPTIPIDQWDDDPGDADETKRFWLSVENLVKNSSFESTVAPEAGDILASWTPSVDTIAGADAPDFYPSANTSAYDHFPNHNALGAFLAKKGTSLKITR
jgi:hypothetical protein